MRLALVELIVSHGPQSVSWYTQVLGCSVQLADEANGFWLLALPGTCLLTLKQGTPQPGGVTLQFEVEHLAREVQRLQLCNVVPVKPLKVSHEGYQRVVFHDPDGCSIVFFEWLKPLAGSGG